MRNSCFGVSKTNLGIYCNLRIKNLINLKFNIAGIYKTWFLKCLGVICVFFTAIAFFCTFYFRSELYKQAESVFSVKCLSICKVIDLQADINRNYDFNISNFIKNFQIEKNSGQDIRVLIREDRGKIHAKNSEEFFFKEISKDICVQVENKITMKKLGNKNFFITSKKITSSDSLPSGHLVLLENVEFIKLASPSEYMAPPISARFVSNIELAMYE